MIFKIFFVLSWWTLLGWIFFSGEMYKNLIQVRSINDTSSKFPAGEISRVERIHVMIVMCNEPKDEDMEEDGSKMVLQAETLLKTLVLFSSRPITVHLAHNDHTIVKQIKAAVSKFGKGNWIRIAAVSIEYPPGMEDMINEYRICATAKMFFPDLLPEVDAGIYLDTDILMLGDPALLWDRFELFSPFTALALAPVDAMYNVQKNNPRIPYYGLPGVGLNSGVFLMNLTRLRALPGGGFTGAVRAIWDQYKGNLVFGDQDVINMVAEQSPYLIQPLPCEWNFIIWQCRRLPIKGSNHVWTKSCPTASLDGIALLHGAGGVFSKDEVLSTVLQFWIEQDVKSWDAVEGLVDLEARVEKAMQEKKGDCANVPDFKDMLLIRLRKMVNSTLQYYQYRH